MLILYELSFHISRLNFDILIYLLIFLHDIVDVISIFCFTSSVYKCVWFHSSQIKNSFKTLINKYKNYFLFILYFVNKTYKRLRCNLARFKGNLETLFLKNKCTWITEWNIKQNIPWNKTIAFLSWSHLSIRCQVMQYNINLLILSCLNLNRKNSLESSELYF